MKIITKKKALKLVGLQVAVLIALVLTQVGMQFADTHKYVGFIAKDESNWIGLAEVAQADKLNCYQDLERVKAEKQQAVEAANPDLK